MPRRFRLWHIATLLTIILTVAIISDRLIGASQQPIFDCIVLNGFDHPLAIDLNSLSEAAIKKPKHFVKLGSDSTNRYTVFQYDDGQQYSLVFTSLSAITAEISNFEGSSRLFWSSDNHYVATAGFGTNGPILLIASADGSNYHMMPVDLVATAGVLAWSDDDQYLSWSDSNSINIMQIKGFVQYRIDNRPLSSSDQWLPKSHQMVYSWGQPPGVNIGFYDMDIKIEERFTNVLPVQAWLGTILSGDGRFLAVYQADGTSEYLLRVFDLSHHFDQEVLTDVFNVPFKNMFWMPDNKALALFDMQGGLSLYNPEENHRITLVPDGITQIFETSDTQDFFFIRNQDQHLSLYVLNLTNYQIHLIRDNIAYAAYYYSQPPRKNDQLFIVTKNGDTFAAELYTASTGQTLHIIDGVPSVPYVRKWNSSVVTVLWKNLNGGGLAKFSLDDKTLKFYHVNVGLRWDLGETRFSFASDSQHVALSLREPGGTLVEIASSDNPTPIILYQSPDSYDWASTLYWASDSSELFYAINDGGPVKLVRQDGSAVATFSSRGDNFADTCDDYFKPTH